MCEEEQNTQALGHIPTVEEYMQRRMGSGAVRLNLALTEFATGSALPQDILLGDSIQAIWHEANVIICIMNDILSLKKEIAQLQVDSIVPLLLLKCGSLQAAVDEATHMAASSIDRLEAAERDTMNHYSSATEEVQEEIRLQIKACKLACTGNIHWSLISGRYYVQPSLTSNEVEMVL
ncbi:isoprenoid synthase domain-containing protein [Nemania diffusa]|nr:isoprenoid synthase domain-containing protein [Nemania diffusa]